MLRNRRNIEGNAISQALRALWRQWKVFQQLDRYSVYEEDNKDFE